MLNFNLLPQKEKEELENKNIKIEILILFKTFISILIVLLLLMVANYLYISIFYNTQKNVFNSLSESPALKLTQESDEKISSMNKKINRVYNIQKNLVFWSPILEELTKNIPENIYLTTITTRDVLLTDEKKGHQITILGFSPIREDVISLKKFLEENPSFLEIESPISNFLYPTNINFSFSFKISR